MINLNDLNEYSNKVYEYLRNHNIELLENISLQPSVFGKNSIFIELTSKNENSVGNLFLSSDENRLTVGFGVFHCHFDTYLEQDFEVEIKKALECFFKILHEELFVVSAGGGVSTLLTNEEINFIESGHKLEKFNYDCISYYVTSWTGNQDRIFKNPN